MEKLVRNPLFLQALPPFDTRYLSYWLSIPCALLLDRCMQQEMVNHRNSAEKIRVKEWWENVTSETETQETSMPAREWKVEASQLEQCLTPESETHALNSSCDFVHICLKVSAIGSLDLRMSKDLFCAWWNTSAGIDSTGIPLAFAYSSISSIVLSMSNGTIFP